MRSFVRVVETGSFTAVAKEQNTNQATISKRVASLEKQLGSLLLVRGGRTHVLTEVGKSYFQRALNILLAIDEAEAEARSVTANPKGVLRITAPSIFGGMYIAPTLPRFLNKYPRIQVDLVLEEKKTDLITEGIDVAIRLGELADSTLVAKKLGYHELIIVTSPEYLKSHSTPSTLKDLEQHNCLMYSLLPKKGTVWSLNTNSVAEDVEVSGNFQCDNGYGIKQMLLVNAGVALLPYWLVHNELKQGKLVRILKDYNKLYPINAVFPKSRYIPLKVRSFLDYLEEVVHLYPVISSSSL